jgi:transposase
MSDGNGLAEAMLGLDGFRVLEVSETSEELTVKVETTAMVVGCSGCGSRAESHDRDVVDVRDLSCFGRPVRLRVLKRRWRCPDPDCETKTWTEQHPDLPPRHVMTRSGRL